MPLAIFCDCTAWFMSDLVGNPEDQFSHNEAHNILASETRGIIKELIRMRSILCTYQYFPMGNSDNFEKLESNSQPMCKYVVSKIPLPSHQTCYIIQFRTSRKRIYFPTPVSWCSNSWGLGFFCCLIPPVSMPPPTPLWDKKLIGAIFPFNIHL